MRELEDAIADIDRAREGIDATDVRTNLDSIKASLQEMLDTAAGVQSDADAAFGDTQFDGAAPSADNLRELETNLRDQQTNADSEDVADHLERARERIERVRTRDARSPERD